MELNIKIFSNNSCKLVVEDKTEYLKETFSGVLEGKFKYSDTASVIILQHNKAKETVTKAVQYEDHTAKYFEIPIDFDGWFSVDYIVLPTRKWFEIEKAKTEGSALNLYKVVYFIDGENIYKYLNGKETQVPIDEVLLVNPVDMPVFKVTKDYISICFLWKCYINLCQQIFNSRGFSSCWNKNTIDSELVYKRDLVWMAINVIKYLTKLHSECNPTLSEVERIIELISGCNGLCTSSSTTQKTSGCGCSN